MLKPYLEQVSTTGYGNSLKDMVRLAGFKPSTMKKVEMVALLDKYLCDVNNLNKIWIGIDPYVKEVMEVFIRGERLIDGNDLKSIALKHNIKPNGYGRYLFDYFPEKSKARLFFINHNMPDYIYNILRTKVKPAEIKYIAKEELDSQGDAELFIGEDFERDVVAVIKLANNYKLRVTKGSGMPTKASVIKINEVLIHKEPLLVDYNEIGDISRIDNTTRIYGLMALLTSAELLIDEDGVLVPGPGVNDFLQSNIVEKCRCLLKGYLYDKSIYELDRLPDLKLSTEWKANMSTCREVIVKYLKGCPIGKWISITEFWKAVKQNDRRFLTKETGQISVYDAYHKYYVGRGSWEGIEGQLIEVFLLEYMSALGIVDVVLSEVSDDFEAMTCWSVDFLRLTPLGAYVLGATDIYEFKDNSEISGFIVQPNFEIVVSEGSSSDAHAFFFDKFAEKVSDGGVSIYRISFKCAVTALDNGITIAEIIDYLIQYSSNKISTNVLTMLKEWERDSKKIKIRTVTIVETDDPYLLEELKSYKTINKQITCELSNVFEIDSKSANKVKREIEKKNKFCIIE